MRKSYDHTCILESATGAERLAELSIIVFDPYCILTSDGDQIRIEDRRSSSDVMVLEAKNSDPLLTVRQIVRSTPARDTQFRFIGGAVGFLGYDAM
ncbi:MAG: hypothetical protein ACREBS_10510, partial [Nitrososphaerales archaeon]